MGKFASARRRQEQSHGEDSVTSGPFAAGLSSLESLPSTNQPTSNVAHNFSNIAVSNPSLLGAQGKLNVSQPSDPREIEADRIADQVVGSAQPEGAGVDFASQSATQQPLARSGDPRDVSTDVDSLVTPTLRGGGQPLSADTRRFMEPRFGHDFSRVRVHADEAASRSAQAVQANAYTVGSDVVFGAGQYAPGTRDGDRLLAHELAHVVQQTGPSRTYPAEGFPTENAPLAQGSSALTTVSRSANEKVLQRDDAAEAPQAVTLDDIDEQKLDAQIGEVVGIARANYVSAVRNAVEQVIIQAQVDESTKKGFEQNLALAIGSLFLPEALGAMSAAIQGTLKDAILPTLRGSLGSDKTLVNKLVEDKFAPSAISGYVTSAQSVLGSKEFLVMGNNKYARTWSYLNGLDSLNAANLTTAGLAAIQGGKAEAVTFFGVMKYLAAHAEIYREDVLTRATHYRDEVADVILGTDVSGSIVGPQLCKIDAYGRDRWARVETGLYGWTFLQWVDPDAAEALQSETAGKPIPRLSPEDIVGHLPDPVLESGGQKTPGGEPMRTEWTNAWGGLRLVEVAVPEGMQGTGEYIFRRWIPAPEQDAAIARGENQIGGIDPARPIPADKIRGKETPTEAPLR